MRRFFTLLCLLCLAVPAGISISGCVRNPQANYCNGEGYGLKITDVASIVLTPVEGGISLAYGQTWQITAPTAYTCKGDKAGTSGIYQYGTTNNQLVDISPSGNICAGTWNRNTGGGIADYTYCNYPNPAPSTSGLPYSSAYITATTSAVVSNPVQVFVHAPVTSIGLAGPSSCLSQTQTAQLDALAYYSNNGTQTLFCQPSATATVTGYSISSNVVTLTASNHFVAGESVTLSGLSSATFLNGHAFTVLSAGLTPGQFEIAATASNAGFTSDSGTATTNSSYPACESSIGTMSFSVGTSSVASINALTNVITAEQPGTTTITASIAGSGSSAGYFSTCPPASIQVSLSGNSTGPVTVTQGVTQNLTTTVLDTNGNTITGLSLDYQSTNPKDISIAAAGAITTSYPGQASVNAICQPTSCNPAPINEIGFNGTGLSISSNPLVITTPGTASEYVWLAAPGQSQYFVPIEVLSGTPSSTVRLPYVPNSAVMDLGGNNLYFGSSRELMIFSTTASAITKQDPGVPGVVLAVAPNNSQVLINDQSRQVFYLYSVTGGISSTFAGMGASAAWTPDSKTLYITDSSSLGGNHSDTLYVYNANSGWTICTAGSPCAADFQGAENLAIAIPGVGAYFSGNSTVSRTWCPAGPVGGMLAYYPQGDKVNFPTDVLAATNDGHHILGATLNSGSMTLADIGVTIPTTQCPGAGSGSLSALSTHGVLNGTAPFSSIASASAVNQVVASPASNLAFVTYTPQNGAAANNQLPYYQVASSGMGAVNYVTLMNGNSASSTVIAPVAGAFSPDDSLFFVSTAGDNLLHFIDVKTLTDTQQLAPNLPACIPVSAGGNDPGCTYTGSGTTVPATVITVKPRPIT